MNKKDILWGSALILVGVALILKLTGILTVNIFFKGWWTLFIIVPCFVNIFKEPALSFTDLLYCSL